MRVLRIYKLIYIQSPYNVLLKTGLGILDFYHFDWLKGARLSAHIPAATKYGQ